MSLMLIASQAADVNAENNPTLAPTSNSRWTLTEEMKRACQKVSANPATCSMLDEDGLNRQIRDFLKSAIERFGYMVADQTQQGFGETEKRPGELDIQISRDGIPMAIFEGLVHRDRTYLYDHIRKAVGRYNPSGCRQIYIVEYFREKRFGTYWDNTFESLQEFSGVEGTEVDSGLNGIKMFSGRIGCEGGYASLVFFGVNAPKNLDNEAMK